MRVLSLFSGMGGFDLALERAGMTVVGQVEIDPACIRVLEKHWPDVRRWTDVRDVGVSLASEYRRHRVGSRNGSVVRDEGSGIDLICGGFPCQDLSVAGKRAGLDGARSGLWFEFQRIVSELRPAYVLVENVPGLLSLNEGRDFAVIIDGLGECGYGVSWAVLDSQHFGVPQRRRRVFVVAGPPDGRTEAILAIAESCGGHPETGRAAGEDVAGTLGGGAGERGWADDTDRMTFVPEVARSVTARDAKGVSIREDAMTYLAVRTAQTSANGKGYGDVAYTLDGAEGQAVAFAQNTRDEVRELGGNVAGALGAQPGMKQQTYIAAASVRRLTPTECLRLQGFPEDWLDLNPPLSDGAKYRMCGNAVTVPVIEWIGRRMMAL